MKFRKAHFKHPVLELLLPKKFTITEIRQWLATQHIDAYAITQIKHDHERTLITFAHAAEREAFMMHWL